MIYYISDFSYEESKGGAESCDNEILKYFKNNNLEFEFIKSINFKNNGNINDFYIVSNFAFLSDQSKIFLSDKKFVIIEHDYKFLENRNPVKYFNFIVPKHKRINVKFYYDSIAVFAQSKFHAEIIKKNLPFANIISLTGSFFSDESLKIIEKYKNTIKNNKFFVYKHPNPIKGTLESIQYCKKNQIEFETIEHCDYEQFIEAASKYNGVVFMPQSPETYCKMLAECKCLGLKIITNKLTGFIGEVHAKKEADLIDFLDEQREKNIKLILDTLLEKQDIIERKNIKNNLVSLVMPVYNSEKFLDNSITDILNQTYKNIEFIIVDDGSKDSSLEIIKKYAKKDKRIKFFSKTNGGTGSALNLGFKNATGKYATWVSSDDIKYPNFLESLVEILDNNEDCKLVFSAFDEYYENNFDKKIYTNFININKVGPIDNFLNISYNYCITGICFMFHMDLKNICGQYENYPGEDYVMGVKMASLTRVYATPESLGAHCLHPESLTVKTPNCVLKANEDVKRFIERINKL